MSDLWSQAFRALVWAKTQGRCWYCGIELVDPPASSREQYRAVFGIDHLVPWHDGGTHELDNLVPACRSCNASKGRRSVEWFRQFKARAGLPHFTQAHMDYLLALGVELPPGFPCYPEVIFYGERLPKNTEGGAA